jgi:hypothetical protein
MSYALGALWLFLAALAVVQSVIADDSTGRWLAALQCVLGVGLGFAALASAGGKVCREEHR